MTPEERIAQLEAELARERARSDGLQEIVHALTVKRRTSGAERQARYRARHSDVTSDASRPPPPSLPPPSSSPSLPAPISPPPISSPNPSLSPPFPPSAAPRNELRLEPQVVAKRTRTKEKPLAAAPDPRHAPLVKALEAAGWAHHGGRTAGAVKELLALADRTGAPGAAHEEVLRRAAIARAHEGFPRVREVHELPKHWGHFERAPAPVHRGGPSPPSDFSRIAPPPPRSPFAREESDEPF
jgi:hypothetical protein